MPISATYWFPAKRYGWGWGMPTAWQGWAVLILYLASLGLSAWMFPPEGESKEFVACVFALSVALVAICYAKGEPPSWRWGG